MNPTNDFIEANKLYITKIDKEGNVFWNAIFENSTEMMIRAATIDANNDIVIIGEHWSNKFIGERRNFLLKIYEDGTTTSTTNIQVSTTKIKIIPNPTNGIVYLEIPTLLSHKNNLGIIVDSFGRVVRQLENSELSQSIDLTSLASGMYYINIYFEGGERYSDRIIKL